MENVMLSIYVTTYNHENYIVRALDSILMQKTRYSYEVFVGEDCSTDNTRQVLRQWEQNHPGVFTILYREQNMGDRGLGNVRDLKKRCTGKYIIALEGDDFWTDPMKLEKQITFLEEHPEYYCVAHKCTVVGEDSQPNGETYPQCEEREYTLRHYAGEVLPGQLTTMLYRNYMTDPDFDRWLMENGVGPGDRNLIFSIASQSRIYCMQEAMSAYRHITSGGSSFSATHSYNFEKEELAMRRRLEFSRRLHNDEAEKYAEMLYLRNLRYAKRRGYVDAAVYKEYKKRVHHMIRTRMLLLRRDINYHLLRRKKQL
jgi:glycosyltransferase involved in cell wall biosynthesis